MRPSKHTDFTQIEHKYIVVKVQLHDGNSACIRTDRVSAFYEQKDDTTGESFTVVLLDSGVEMWVKGSLSLITKMMWNIE